MSTLKKEVAFIDANVADLDQLIAGLRSEVQHFVLNAGQSATEQIARALAGKSGLSAIHIIAHGRPGEIQFAAGALSLDNLEDYTDDLLVLGQALGEGGVVQIYSCNAAEGEQGRRFVRLLADFIGADVFASADKVGAAEFGGDWSLQNALALDIADVSLPFKAQVQDQWGHVLTGLPPVIITNTTLGVTEGTSDNTIGISLLNTSDDEEGSNDIVYTLTDLPDHGQLTKNGVVLSVNDTFTQSDINDGKIKYNSFLADETATDSFGFSVSDGTTTLTGNTFAIDVTSVNEAPTVAAPVTTTAAEGVTAFNLDLLAGATDVDVGDVLSVTAVTYTVNGTPTGSSGADLPDGVTRTGATLNINPTHAAFDHLGDGDTMLIVASYTISDGNGGTVAQTATVTITGTNDVPVIEATDVTGAVTELVSATGNLTDSGTIAFSDVDLTDVHSVGTVTASSGALGSLTASVTTGTNDTTGLGGVVTWNYTVAASAVEYLAAGQTKVETFTFNVEDGQGGSVERTVEVTIHGTNDAPVVEATDVTGAVTELVSATGNLTDSGTIAFSDVDLTDVHSVGTVTASSGALGSLTASVTTGTNDTTGLGGVVTWNYTVAASAVEYLAAGQTKVETFTFNVEDGQGGSVERTVEVTIHGTNDAPVVEATDVTGAVTELVSATGNLTDSGTIAFSDVDLTDVHSVGTVTASSGALGSLTASVTTGTNDTTGLGGVVTWNYTVAASAVEYLAAGQTKVETFTFNVEDGQGGSVERTVEVTIHGTNDVPVVEATDVTGAVTELVSATGNLTDSGTIAFSDVDLTDVHSVGTVTASSGALGSLTASVTTGTNDTTGLGGVVTWNYTVAASAVEYLAAGQTKVETFTFNVEDGQGGSVERTVEVTIHGTNDAPVVEATDVTGAVTELVSATGNLTDSGTIAFSDVDLTDVHSVGTVTASSGALGSLTASVTTGTNDTTGLGGVVTWNYTVAASAVEYLAAGQTKVETFTFNVEDGQGGSVERTVEVTIHGTNDAPVVEATDVTGAVTELVSATGNLTDSGTIAFSDVDLTDVHSVGTVTASNGALGSLTASVTTGTNDTTGLGGVVTWNYTVAASAVEYLAAGQTKVETFTFNVEDGQGGSVERTVEVTIHGTNDAPVVEATDVTGAVTELVSATGNLTDSGTIAFSDVDLTDVHSVGTVTASSGAPGQPDRQRHHWHQRHHRSWRCGHLELHRCGLRRGIPGGRPDQGRDLHLQRRRRPGRQRRAHRRSHHPRHQRRAGGRGHRRHWCGHRTGQRNGQPHRLGHHRLLRR
jgi:VCBS repeat-containing protein